MCPTRIRRSSSGSPQPSPRCSASASWRRVWSRSWRRSACWRCSGSSCAARRATRGRSRRRRDLCRHLPGRRRLFRPGASGFTLLWSCCLQRSPSPGEARLGGAGADRCPASSSPSSRSRRRSWRQLPLFVYLVVLRRRVGVSAVVTLGVLLDRLHPRARPCVTRLVRLLRLRGAPEPGDQRPRHASPSSRRACFVRPAGPSCSGWWGLHRAVRRAGRPRAAEQEASPNWPFWIAVGVGLVGASWLSLVHAGGSSDVLMPAYAAVAIFAGLGYRRAHSGSGSRYRELLGAILAVVIAVQVVQLDHGSLHEIPSAASDGGRAPLHRARVVAAGAGDRGRPSLVRHNGREAVVGPVRGRARRLAIRLRARPDRPLEASIEATLASPSVTTVFVDNHGRHHRAGIRPLLQTGSTGVHLRRGASSR